MPAKKKKTALKIKKKTKVPKTKQSMVPWVKIKTDWLSKNLDPKAKAPYTFVQCAKFWSINASHLSTVANEEGWKEELTKQASIIAQDTLDKIKKDAVESEGEIRLRQADQARLAQTKARLALEGLDPSTLEPRDIIKMLALGLIEERKALGFPDKIEFDDLSKDKTQDYESPQEKVEKAKALNRLSDKLLKKMQPSG